MSADIVSACPQTFQVCLEAISAHVSTHLCYGFLPDSAIYGTINLTIHHYGGGLRPPPQQWGGPTVVDSIILDREAASIGIPKTYTQSELIPDQGRVF